MSVVEAVSFAALALAALPAALCAINLLEYRRPRRPSTDEDPPRVSVLIPARDEAGAIDGAIDAVLANTDVTLELIVMDDHSTDGTAEIVAGRAAGDDRVRLASAPPLPSGWNGKQHACAALAALASHDTLVFVDADVRLAPDALGRVAAELRRNGSGMISGFPRQRTGTWLERLLIPLIHFVLLGFLPLAAMRRSRSPAFAAGCGQLVAARAGAYRTAGGHGAIAHSRHDGIMLPRAFRRAGIATDLFDATSLASCRMYRGAAEVWNGLAKNATEGMASPGGILPWTLLLLGGHVVPLGVLLAGLAVELPPAALAAAGVAFALGLLTRAALAIRFAQPWQGVLLHPLGVALLVGVQWFALARDVAGRPVPWKGR